MYVLKSFPKPFFSQIHKTLTEILQKAIGRVDLTQAGSHITVCWRSVHLTVSIYESLFLYT